MEDGRMAQTGRAILHPRSSILVFPILVFLPRPATMRTVMAAAGTPHIPVTIRSYRPADLPACRKLYVEGLVGGKLAENDTGMDIDDIESAYMRREGNHFWVAETPEGEVIGMIGVQHHDEGSG